jgi:hypothetical protein
VRRRFPIKCRAPRVTNSGPLAQLVEHRTFNPMVVGSNPTRPTIFSKIPAFLSLN